MTIKFSEKFIINFGMLVKCFLNVAVSFLCRLQAGSNIHVLIYSYLIGEKQNYSTLWPVQQRSRDSQVSAYKPIYTYNYTKYQHIRKWMDEFLRKNENRGIKIDRVNSIRITKSIHQFKFFTVLGVRCDIDIF